MPLKCSVCNHKENEKLNVALINGTPMREIQKFFGVSKSSLSRHKLTCLPMIVAASLQTNTNEDGEDGPEPETVLGKANEMCGKGRLAILYALKRKDYKTAFTGMREHRGYSEMIGRINGELGSVGGQPANHPLFIFQAGAQISFGPTIARQIEEPRNITPTLPSATNAEEPEGPEHE